MRDMKHNGFGKRLCLLAVAVCMMLACMPLSAFAEEAEEIVIPEDAIWLSTPEDILTLAENCVSDAWSRNKVVVLKNDIDLSGVDFVPIPTFGGTFLGQGFTVSGLRRLVRTRVSVTTSRMPTAIQPAMARVREP